MAGPTLSVSPVRANAVVHEEAGSPHDASGGWAGQPMSFSAVRSCVHVAGGALSVPCEADPYMAFNDEVNGLLDLCSSQQADSNVICL